MNVATRKASKVLSLRRWIGKSALGAEESLRNIGLRKKEKPIRCTGLMYISFTNPDKVTVKIKIVLQRVTG